ncbi:hypothetical protein EON78_04905 [bacterium]|nr:MAG: hypothetical protein EON78_04905 [bacterium]
MKIFYDENQVIQGQSMLDVLSNIGQSDRLTNTYSDEIRCGSAVTINSVLLTKGATGFYDLSKKLGLNLNSLTYENIHLAQEKLMDKVSGAKGLSISKNIDKNQIIGGTLVDALNIADLRWSTDAVKKVNGSFQDDINNYFKTNSNGVIILTGSLDKDLNKMVFNKTTDHSALLSYKNNKFIITDTSGRNGTGLNNIELNDKDLQEIYTSNQTFIKIIN